MDEQIKPVAWKCFWVADHDGGCWQQYHDGSEPMPEQWEDAPDEITPLYSQQSIDALRAEVEGLRAACDKWSERELLFGAHEDLQARAERAEAELEAMRWVVEQYVTLQTDGGGRWRVEFGYTSPVTYGPWADSRMAAIDAARKGAE